MQESFKVLGLDISQLLANFIGFAAFLWLMRKFAWGPILEFMDKRSDEISNNYQAIDEEKKQVEALRLEYEGYLDTKEQEGDRIVQKGIKEAELAGREIKDQATDDAGRIREKLLEQARLELKNHVVEVGVEAGRLASMDVMDGAAHRRMVEKFVEELANVR
jgi:F-type H+-transporting ATPase subunit b